MNCLLSIFQVLSASDNLRIINGQNSMSGENIRKLDTRKTVSRNERWNYMLTRLSDNLLKLDHHAGFIKTEQMNHENSPQQI